MTHGRVERDRSERRRGPRIGRGLLAFALVLALSGASGCMVMDELDTAAAKMPTSAADKEKKKGNAKTAPASAAERLAATKRMVDERSRKWWSEAKSMTPGESTAGVVNCRLPEGRKFMAKDDCLAQGGRLEDGRG